MNDFSGKEPPGPSTHLEDTPPTPPVVRTVLEFGADNKGESDSTVAINEAITAVEASGGGTVKFPEGLYKVGTSDSVILLSGVTLAGDSRKSTIRLANCSTLTGSGAALVGKGVSGFDICDLVLDGNRENQDNLVSLIRLSNCSRVEITGNKMVDCANESISLTDCHGVFCCLNYMVDSQGTNIKIGGESSNIQISQNEMQDTGEFSRHDDGFIKVCYGQKGPESIEIIDNIMKSPQGSGLAMAVWLRSGYFIKLVRNKVDVSCTCILVQADVSMLGLEFEDNELQCRGAGVEVSSPCKKGACVEGEINYLKIVRNTIVGCASTGISVNPCRKGIQVLNLVIESNAITIQASDKNNKGILAESAIAKIVQNIIHLEGSVAGDGIQVAFDEVTVEGNEIHASGINSRGIANFGDHCTIKGNHIHGTDGYAIFNHKDTDHVLVDENQLFGCGEGILNQGPNSTTGNNPSVP
ncbi:glycoside hydrolase family 55 protein [Myxococcota bacterium]|nr:glycoside hydrolase family 55 protein [Myxococcota bacterium]